MGDTIRGRRSSQQTHDEWMRIATRSVLILSSKPSQVLDSPCSVGPTTADSAGTGALLKHDGLRLDRSQTFSSDSSSLAPRRVQGSCNSFSESSSAIPSRSRLCFSDLGAIKLASWRGTRILLSRTRLPLIASPNTSHPSNMGIQRPSLVEDTSKSPRCRRCLQARRYSAKGPF